MTIENAQPIKLVIAALGGQGGGVLAGWISTLARNVNWPCQSTSVPGVAQRTGATIYYIEMFPIPKDQLTNDPVLSLFPTKGDVDIVLASEIVEAGRMIERGFVTHERTHLIASNHRVYAVGERSSVADTTIDVNKISEIAISESKQITLFDMQKLAELYGTVISAALFGALAGAQVLPFEKKQFETIFEGEANAQAFEAAFVEAQSQKDSYEDPVEFYAPEKVNTTFTLPRATTTEGQHIIKRIDALPKALHKTLFFGAQKLNDYLDYNYAHDYLKQVEKIASADNKTSGYALTEAFSTQLALWASHEDIIRVAHLKVKQSRSANLSQEVGVKEKEILHVHDFFKPRVEEICGLLPAKMGHKCLESKRIRKFLGFFTTGKQLASSNIWVFLLLRGIAGLRRFRRNTYAYTQENIRRQNWIEAVQANLSDQQKAHALAQFASVIKGYGATRERGYRQMERLLNTCQQMQANDIDALRKAALQDDAGTQFDQLFNTLAAA